MTPIGDLPSVSIVIPTYQGVATLPATLTAIRAQDYPSPVELVAIDSTSTDGTRAVLESFGARVTVIPQSEFTHGYARNLGVQQATGSAIVFLSQDALPIGSHWLAGLIAPLTDPTIGAVYARQVSRPDATPLEIYFHESLYPPRSKTYRLSGADSTALDQIFFSNVCSAALRSTCLRFPLDETIIMSEDQAFARAVLQAGYSTRYLAEVQVAHSHHYTLSGLFRRNFDSAYSLRGVTSDGAFSMARQGVSYIAGEAGYVIRARRWRWLFAIPPYEVARIAGRLFGARADRLPQRWRLTLSLHRSYWLRPKN